MVALLTLHTGANCSRVSLQGLQQLAALETAVERVNAEDSSAGLQLGKTYSYLIRKPCIIEEPFSSFEYIDNDNYKLHNLSVNYMCLFNETDNMVRSI